jgi:hypothetical protein
MIIPEFSTRGCQLGTLIPSTVVPQNFLGSHRIFMRFSLGTLLVAVTLSFVAILNGCSWTSNKKGFLMKTYVTQLLNIESSRTGSANKPAAR